MLTPTRAQVRLFAFWTFVAVVAGGCAARGATSEEQTRNALTIAGISGVFIISMWLTSRWLGRLGWPPQTKGAALGFIFSLIVSAIIIKRIPLETQLLAIGAIAGIGTDFVSGVKETTGPRTIVERFASYVSNLIEGVGQAAATTSLTKPSARLISAGIWAFILTILITLIVGNLF
jgi:hypothetical protein